MSDLVQRLRLRQRVTTSTSTGQTGLDQIIEGDPLCAEAAAEIESLRDLLRICRAERDDLAAQHYALRADAERWRYINTRNNIWRRDDSERPCSMLCVVLPYGADLSCRATREDAIDAAMKERHE